MSILKWFKIIKKLEYTNDKDDTTSKSDDEEEAELDNLKQYVKDLKEEKEL